MAKKVKLTSLCGIRAHLFVKQQLQAEDCLLQFHRYSKKKCALPSVTVKNANDL